MEGQSFFHRTPLVVLAHPGNQLPIAFDVAEVVGEAFPHDGVERAHSVLHEVVHHQGGDPIGLEGDRAKAVLHELHEQLVAYLREGRFPMGRLPQRQQLT